MPRGHGRGPLAQKMLGAESNKSSTCPERVVMPRGHGRGPLAQKSLGAEAN